MNKKYKTIIITAVMLSFMGGATAQSHYYHLVGDTVVGRSPIYYYDWWPNVDSLGHLPDSAIQSDWPEWLFNLHTTTDTLKIIGIASTLSYLNMQDMVHPYEDCDTTIDTNMYYILFDATPAGPVELARVCWTDDYNTHPKRYMALPLTYSSSAPYPNASGNDYCRQLVDDIYVTSLREYYFANPVIVTDSFYLGWEIRQRDAHDPAMAEAIMRYHHVFMDASLTNFHPTAPCNQNFPPHRQMYRNTLLGSDSSWTFKIDSTTYPTIFAIIEVDTVGLPYDTLRFTCLVPTSLRVIARDNYFARIEWVDNSDNAEWMVSVVSAGGNPDDGRMIITSSKNVLINGLSPDTSYNVYVKGWCKKTMWEGWSEWSDYVTLEAIPPHGIAVPVGERFSLSPNPASGTVTVTTEAQQGILTVVDMQGRQVLSMPLTGKETVVDIRALAAGTYIVSLNTPKGHSSLKLTVE